MNRKQKFAVVLDCTIALCGAVAFIGLFWMAVSLWEGFNQLTYRYPP